MIKILCILFLISISLFKVSPTNIRGLQTCNYSFLNNLLSVIPPLKQNVNILGNATSYGVLAGSRTTNDGNTTIVGDLGTFPSIHIDGTECLIIGGSKHAGDAHAANAQESLTNAYNYLAGLPAIDYTGTDLVGPGYL